MRGTHGLHWDVQPCRLLHPPGAEHSPRRLILHGTHSHGGTARARAMSRSGKVIRRVSHGDGVTGPGPETIKSGAMRVIRAVDAEQVVRSCDVSGCCRVGSRLTTPARPVGSSRPAQRFRPVSGFVSTSPPSRGGKRSRSTHDPLSRMIGATWESLSTAPGNSRIADKNHSATAPGSVGESTARQTAAPRGVACGEREPDPTLNNAVRVEPSPVANSLMGTPAIARKTTLCGIPWLGVTNSTRCVNVTSLFEVEVPSRSVPVRETSATSSSTNEVALIGLSVSSNANEDLD